MNRQWVLATVALAAAFSGVAVLVSILSGIALGIAEAALVIVPLASVVLITRRAPRPIVHEVWRLARAGALAGLAATIAYDVTRTALSILDPSPYNPFEAIRLFGLGVVPEAAGLPLVMAAGAMVHVVNGVSFGVIYAALAARRPHSRRDAVVRGLAWGLTLELVQSILYPGWLGITTVLREFLVISGAGHIMYGLALGLAARRLLERGWARGAAGKPGESLGT